MTLKPRNLILKVSLMMIIILSGGIAPNRMWDCKSPISTALYSAARVPRWVEGGLIRQEETSI